MQTSSFCTFAEAKYNAIFLPIYKDFKRALLRMTNFKVQTEQFANIRILRYQVPGFENLTFEKKCLVYFLSQAALWSRDIIYDQNYKHNLLIRFNLANIYKTYSEN